VTLVCISPNSLFPLLILLGFWTKNVLNVWLCLNATSLEVFLMVTGESV
jgi:hypothetical protein